MPVNPTQEMFQQLIDQNNMLLEQNQKLTATVDELNKTISDLNNTIAVLREQINKNSGNSSKPPSSDGLKKKPVSKDRSLRTKTGRKKGAQAGHEGSHLNFFPSLIPFRNICTLTVKTVPCGTSVSKRPVFRKHAAKLMPMSK